MPLSYRFFIIVWSSFFRHNSCRLNLSTNQTCPGVPSQPIDIFTISAPSSIARRRLERQSCSHQYPRMFTNSRPSEATQVLLLVSAHAIQATWVPCDPSGNENVGSVFKSG